VSGGIDLEYRNPKNNDNTVLHAAVENGDSLVVKLLIDQGAPQDIRNKDNQTPLELATKLLEPLKQNYYRADIRSEIAVMMIGLEQIIELLGGERADFSHYQDENGDTPLHFYVRERYSLSVKQLIQRGFPVNLSNHNNETPLNVAIRIYNENAKKLIGIKLKEMMRKMIQILRQGGGRTAKEESDYEAEEHTDLDL
jgi:ankyrin repeat protein